VAGLERERREIEAGGGAAAPDPMFVDLDRILRLAEARIRDLRLGLAAGGERARAALRALAGDEPLRVAPDPDRKFRVDGWLWLSLGGEESRARATRPGTFSEVAGGRYVRDEPALLDEYAPLPWAA